MKKEKSKEKSLIIEEQSLEASNLHPLSKESNLQSPSLPSPDPPPSNSSGYHSLDDEDIDEYMQVTSECCAPEDCDFNALISMYLEDPEYFNDDFINGIVGENEEPVSLDDIKVDGKFCTL